MQLTIGYPPKARRVHVASDKVKPIDQEALQKIWSELRDLLGTHGYEAKAIEMPKVTALVLKSDAFRSFKYAAFAEVDECQKHANRGGFIREYGQCGLEEPWKDTLRVTAFVIGGSEKDTYFVAVNWYSLKLFELGGLIKTNYPEDVGTSVAHELLHIFEIMLGTGSAVLVKSFDQTIRKMFFGRVKETNCGYMCTDKKPNPPSASDYVEFAQILTDENARSPRVEEANELDETHERDPGADSCSSKRDWQNLQFSRVLSVSVAEFPMREGIRAC